LTAKTTLHPAYAFEATQNLLTRKPRLDDPIRTCCRLK
jgi:hypothetical protein